MPRKGKRLTIESVTTKVRDARDAKDAERHVRDLAEQLIDDAQRAIATPGGVIEILKGIANMRGEYLHEGD